ncbi:transcription elongation factor 1, partial [Tremellales sp. Uapishka_1]
MGKRKSSKKPQTKAKMAPLSSTFKCLFCHHEKAVSVKMLVSITDVMGSELKQCSQSDKQAMFGSLNCKICGQKYATPINNLSVAVDVYCDWVDACEEVNLKQPPKKRAVRAPEPLDHGSGGGATLDIRNKAIVEADEDAEGDDDDDDERPSGGKNSQRRDEDDEDEDADEDEEDRGGKRRRVEGYSDDDDDD